jgi:pyrophosphatase PpaX
MPEQRPGGGFDPVVFDLDGTVVDTVELITESFRYATRTVLGEVLPDEVITAGVGQPLIQQMQLLSAAHAEELYDVYREYNHRRHDELIRGYAGVEEMLLALKAAGRRLGIVTSKSADATAMAFRAVGLAGHFDIIITASDTTEHKPSPAPIRLCLERLAAEPAGAIYVGDSPFDIQAGASAGTATAAVAWGVFSRAALMAARPDFWVRDPGELLAVCLGGVSLPAGIAAARGERAPGEAD